MSDSFREILPVSIEDELRNSYLDYAMSVIVGRALPDARDGLKPVHRRVLFAMNELKNNWNSGYKKSARIVGDVIGKYHPHGDSAVYDTIVRLAQPFSLRYPLVDGQGNFGSVDGDRPAAMRYTEIRMARLAHELLMDLEKDTVDFIPNYDNTEFIPDVLPAKFPNLLVNGSSGIAVGMATNIPPHNLAEVVSACLATLDNPKITNEELMTHVPAPDFPTGGQINGLEGTKEAYRTGRGRVLIRSVYHLEEGKRGENSKRIVFTEIPYQVNKARVIEKIAELVKERRIEGIGGLRDESDKDGMRIVIDVKRGEVPEVIVNNLFTQTSLENSFGINLVALVDGEPMTLSLIKLINCFLQHRRTVITRRTLFELKRARDKGHLLEGQAVALANIDPVIEVIKNSPNPAVARARLIARTWCPGQVSSMLERSGGIELSEAEMSRGFGLIGDQYKFTEKQAQSILDLRLNRLTGLEIEKLLGDYKNIVTEIVNCETILSDPKELTEVIRFELSDIREKFGNVRRSQIIDSQISLSTEDLIARESMVVTLSKTGYAKSQPLGSYQNQRRGGRGKTATNLREEDVVSNLVVANSHDTVLLFTDKGRLFWIKVYEIPQAGRTAQGKPLVNMIGALEDGQKVTAILAIDANNVEEGRFVFLATAGGVVKKVPLSRFAKPRVSGIKAIDLDCDDTLISAKITDGSKHIILVNSNGRVCRFSEESVRSMGREARGVRGIKLRRENSEKMVAMLVVDSNCQDSLLLASSRGFGKRTRIEDFPRKGRGNFGVIGIQTSQRNGNVIGACQVQESQDVLLISDGGTMVRTPVRDISLLGRNTQGVTLIRLSDNELLVGIDCIAKDGLDCLEPEND